MLLTHRKLLQSKAIATADDEEGDLAVAHRVGGGHAPHLG
jgi:hypothetical protein